MKTIFSVPETKSYTISKCNRQVRIWDFCVGGGVTFKKASKNFVDVFLVDQINYQSSHKALKNQKDPVLAKCSAPQTKICACMFLDSREKSSNM